MNLADPDLELIDPTPNVHSLFMQFDKLFFWTKLYSRATVRWSKRMYSCAGICSYEGYGGLCDIALSEPLLKLRPRKNLIETLLHEMIHAYLFVTGNDRDRDGHGPNFQAHMHRINKAASIDITIYHDFHDEVKLYQTHVWRCNGPCQNMKPFFGIVRRSMNRAPGPSDFWWKDHQRRCSGKFIKTNEPDMVKKKKATAKKQMGDIIKYVNNNNSKDVQNKNVPSNNSFTKANGGGTVVLTPKTGNTNVNKTSPISTVTINKVNRQIPLFDGKGQTLGGGDTVNDNVKETVRDIWAKKQQTMDTKSLEGISNQVREIWANKAIPGNSNINHSRTKKNTSSTKPTSPPTKVRKIDDYFQSVSELLEDVYGKDSGIKPENVLKKTIVSNDINLVECPICASKVTTKDINRHIDECLNKDEIENFFKTEDFMISPSTSKSTINKTDSIVIESIDLTVQTEPTLKTTVDKNNSNDTIKVNEDYIKNFYKDCNLPLPQIKATSPTVHGIKTFVDKFNETVLENDPVQSGTATKCPCCEIKIYKRMEEHLDECLAFFSDNDTIPDEGASTSYASIPVDDDDDVLYESSSMNATGTKTPCPVCLTMVEQDLMNDHLDLCLSS